MGNDVAIYKYIIPRKRGLVIRALLFTLTLSSLFLGWRLSSTCGRALLPPTPSVQLDHFRINRSLKNYIDSINVLIEPSNVVCTNNKKIPMLVLVTSSPSRFENREAIRSTWARYFPTYFIMGLNGTAVEDLKVDNYIEAKMHSDVIIYKFQDHYQNLTLKTALMIEWTILRCSTNLLLFKTDDDVLVNPWLLEEVVKEHQNKDLIDSNPARANEWYINFKCTLSMYVKATSCLVVACTAMPTTSGSCLAGCCTETTWRSTSPGQAILLMVYILKAY